MKKSIFFVLLTSASAIGMEEGAKPRAGQVVEAKIFLYPERPRYAGFEKNWSKWDQESKLQKALGRKLQPNEFLFRVGVFNAESDNFSCDGVESLGMKAGQFPERLPFDELKKLKEGQSGEVEIKDIKFKLTGVQGQTKYSDKGYKTFEKMLLGMIKVAQQKGQNYVCDEEKDFIEAGVLQKGTIKEPAIIHQGGTIKVEYKDVDGYVNGPNGFNFDEAFKELESNQ